MRVLLVGENGFVASSLIEFFSEYPDIDLYSAGSKKLNLLDEAAVDRFFEEEGYFDVVINTAVWSPLSAPQHERAMELQNDLIMFFNLAKQEKYYGRLINFGSGAEYDKTRDICSVKEEDCFDSMPTNQYGIAKYIIAKYIEKTEKIYNLRIFGLYGKNEDYRVKFITGACCKAALGIPITIRQNVYFDFLYIDDFCRMLYQFMKVETPGFHTYNIVSGKRVDLKTIAETVNRISGRNVPIIICQDGLAKEYTASNARLVSEIGYQEFTSLEESIEKLYNYYSGMKDELDLRALIYQGW